MKNYKKITTLCFLMTFSSRDYSYAMLLDDESLPKSIKTAQTKKGIKDEFTLIKLSSTRIPYVQPDLETTITRPLNNSSNEPQENNESSSSYFSSFQNAASSTFNWLHESALDSCERFGKWVASYAEDLPPAYFAKSLLEVDYVNDELFWKGHFNQELEDIKERPYLGFLEQRRLQELQDIVWNGLLSPYTYDKALQKLQKKRLFYAVRNIRNAFKSELKENTDIVLQHFRKDLLKSLEGMGNSKIGSDRALLEKFEKKLTYYRNTLNALDYGETIARFLTGIEEHNEKLALSATQHKNLKESLINALRAISTEEYAQIKEEHETSNSTQQIFVENTQLALQERNIALIKNGNADIFDNVLEKENNRQDYSSYFLSFVKGAGSLAKRGIHFAMEHPVQAFTTVLALQAAAVAAATSIKTNPEPSAESSQDGQATKQLAETIGLNYKNYYTWEHFPSVQSPTQGYSQRVYKVRIGSPISVDGHSFQPLYESRDQKKEAHKIRKTAEHKFRLILKLEGYAQIKPGELGLFREEKKIFCKVHNKEKIEIIRSNDLSKDLDKGLQPEAFDRLLKAMNDVLKKQKEDQQGFKNFNYNLAFESITESDKSELLQYTNLQSYIPTQWKHQDEHKYSYPLGEIYFWDNENREEVIIESGIQIPPPYPYIKRERYKPFGSIKWLLENRCLKPWHQFQREWFFERPDGTSYDLQRGDPQEFPLNQIEHVKFKSIQGYSYPVLKVALQNEIMGYKILFYEYDVKSIRYLHKKKYTLLKNNDIERKCLYKVETYITPDNDHCGFHGTLEKEFAIKTEEVEEDYKYIKTIPCWLCRSHEHIYARCAELYGMHDQELSYDNKLQDKKIQERAGL